MLFFSRLERILPNIKAKYYDVSNFPSSRMKKSSSQGLSLESLYKNEYAFGAFFLRWTFALLFLFVGIKKLRMGYVGFADGLVNSNSLLVSELPPVTVYLYGLLLPITELLIGMLLIVNRYKREVYTLIGFVYLTFVFGQMYNGNTEKIGVEYIPSIIALVLLVWCEIKAKTMK